MIRDFDISSLILINNILTPFMFLYESFSQSREAAVIFIVHYIYIYYTKA